MDLRCSCCTPSPLEILRLIRVTWCLDETPGCLRLARRIFRRRTGLVCHEERQSVGFSRRPAASYQSC
jgi:hypothetical protein